MKICLINCVYGIGSTGKIVRDLHLALRKEAVDSFVICPEENKFTSDPRVYTVSNKILSKASAAYRRLSGRQYDGAYMQTNRILHILNEEKPDIVHLHCINGNNINVYRLLRYLSDNKIRTVLTLHAEFPYTGGCGISYECERWKTGCGSCPIRKEATQSVWIDGTADTWKKWKSCYDRFDQEKLVVTAVSPWLADRARQSPMIGRFRIEPVMNCLDTEIFCYRSVTDIRDRYGIDSEEKIVFHATASFMPESNDLKGGCYIVELAKRLKPLSVRVIVAANYGKVGDLPDNLIFVGRTGNQKELAALYSAADLTVITSKRETFSMVTAESLCCGTPVVGFKAGGPESIALPQFSEFVEYGNMTALENAALHWLQQPKKSQEISSQGMSQYSCAAVTQKYQSIYRW